MSSKPFWGPTSRTRSRYGVTSRPGGLDRGLYPGLVRDVAVPAIGLRGVHGRIGLSKEIVSALMAFVDGGLSDL
jgi:hypothetical protein